MSAESARDLARVAVGSEPDVNGRRNGELPKSAIACPSSEAVGSQAGVGHSEVSEGCSSLLLDAAYDEYCRLIESGVEVNIEEYCAEFPGIRTDLEHQIEVHHLILNHPSLIQECVDAAWPRPGDDILGFLLLEELGRGSFSRVYLASDTSLGGRQIVVKVCRSLSHEAQILGKLAHENIVPVHSVQVSLDAGFSLLCMPYLGRATLHHIVARVWRSSERPHWARAILAAARIGIAPAEVSVTDRTACRLLRRGTYVDGIVFISLKIVNALAHAHRFGVLHLDLKPSNVLLTENGCPMVLDFNLAADRHGRTPRVGGTLPYMSPEQAKCFLEGAAVASVDERSDIYSFGVLLHELLCGVLPYGNVAQTLSSRGCRGASEPAVGRHTRHAMASVWCEQTAGRHRRAMSCT